MKRFLIALLVLVAPLVSANDLVIELPDGGITKLSYAEIKAMPSKMYTTHLPWFEGESTFVGVSLENLLLTFISDGVPDKISVRALNDYAVDVSGADITAYHPIIAYLRDGKKMKIRDKGPYWLIYSLKNYPDIDTSEYHSQMVWQIKTIKILNND